MNRLKTFFKAFINGLKYQQNKKNDNGSSQKPVVKKEISLTETKIIEERIGDILILNIPEEYSLTIMMWFWDLAHYQPEDSTSQYTNLLKNVNHIIINGEKFKYADQFGGELFYFKKHFQKNGGGHFLFCSLSKDGINFFDDMANFFKEDKIENFLTLETALEFIKSNPINE